MKKGYALRVQTVRDTFGHLPPWRCWSASRGLFYLCGHCFALRGDGPATNAAEIWKPGTDRTGTIHHGVVPKGAWCEDCGGPVWPQD